MISQDCSLKKHILKIALPKNCFLKKCISKMFEKNCSLSLKNFLYFRMELAKPKNKKFLIFLFTLKEHISNISAKGKSFLYSPLERKKKF